MSEAGSVSSGADLSEGSVVGRYVLRGTLGRGGMGVVYEGHDPELDRRVALKVLNDVMDSSAIAQARLRREAQALAKLSHPNVVAVYDVGTFGGRIFLAMERVEGITLAAWLAGAPRSCEEVLAVFCQAGAGLAAAHTAGLIHRDFKPENVLVDGSGRARVLDFGLARAADSAAGEAASPAPEADTTGLEIAETLLDAPANADPVAMARTVASGSGPVSESRRLLASPLASPLTATGMLLGTPLYMSPEQHLRNQVDARTDQFSFCVALYEALYGQRPFQGDTLIRLRLAVIKGAVASPPKSSRVPARVRRAVLRGLSPSPADRFPDMDALLAELSSEERRPSRRGLLAAGAALGLGALGIALGARAWKAKPATGPVRYERWTFNGARVFCLSFDERHLAYFSERKLVVRDLSSGAERAVLHDANEGPFMHWISDTEIATLDPKGKCVAVSIESGAVRDFPYEMGRSPDGTMAMGYRPSSKEVRLVEVATGKITVVPVRGEYTWLWDARLSPRGGLLLVTTRIGKRSMFSTVTLDGPAQQTIASDIGLGRPCFSTAGDAIYHVRGLMERRGGESLVRVRIDPRSGAPLGPPETVLSNLSTRTGEIVLSPDGKKLYLSRGEALMHLWSVDLSGPPGKPPRAERITTRARYREGLALSPDGKLAALSEADADMNLVAIALDSGAQQKLASLDDVSQISHIAWSPDGAELAVTAVRARDGRGGLYRLPAAGGKLTPFDLEVSGDLAWTPDSSILAQMEGNQNFYVVDSGASRARPLLSQVEGWLLSPVISRDGKTAFFYWNRKGGTGIWVVSLADGGARLLAEGDFTPVGLSPDGDSIYVVSDANGRDVTTVSIATGATTPLGKLPFEERVQEAIPVPGTSRFVCLVSEGGPDLWVAEGVDL